jgi:PhzF family phenazine biosynthesis protein
MNNIRIKQVDAFTRKPFTGNPAGVVLDADQLNSREMQKIASEMNLSETVFVLKSTHDEADLRLRWFTPKQEVNLCGHATIAAFHALAEEGYFGLEVNEPQSFIVETKSGDLTVDVEWQEFHPYIKFSLPLQQFYPYPGDLSLLCGALGIAEIELSQKVKPQILENGFCYVPLKTYDSLQTLDPNNALLKKLFERYEINGFAVVTSDTGNDNIDWYMRFFAPALGVNEDPVTGSANGPMATYLYVNDFLDKSKKFFTFKGAQGHFMDRPGYVSVYLKTNGESIEEVQIAGEAITVMNGNMVLKANLPEEF